MRNSWRLAGAPAPSPLVGPAAHLLRHLGRVGMIQVKCNGDVRLMLMTVSGPASMRFKRTVSVLVGLAVALFAMAAGTQAAFSADRPTNVAFVKANPIVQLKSDGSTIVKERIRCQP